MTPGLELLFETKIDTVAKNISSIYTTEDVIIILKSLRQAIDELPKADTTSFTKEQIISSVKDLLNEYDWDEFIECDPELNGSYGDSYSLEMNTSFDEREFERSFLSELEDYFTPVDN
jgi:hypothetical protein